MTPIIPSPPPPTTVLPPPEQQQKKGVWLFWFTVFLFIVDVALSVLLMTPLVPWFHNHEGGSDSTQHHHYTLAGSLLDVLVLAICRFLTSFGAYSAAYLRGQIRNEYSFTVYHPNGTKKTRDELEEEALEQSFGQCFRTYVVREAFAAELVALITTLLGVVKCLLRLQIELGTKRHEEPIHPLFWGAILFASVMAAIEMSLVDSVCVRLGEWGHSNQQQTERGHSPSPMRPFSSTLSLPLLANDGLEGNTDEGGGDDDDDDGAIDEAATPASNPDPGSDDENVVGVSDIGGDAGYKASWSDLIKLCAPDSGLIIIAFLFLLLAAAAQIYIPKYTGAILDALEQAYSSNDDDNDDSPNNMDDDRSGGGDGIDTVPGFMSNVKKLIVVSILGGVFSGVRGSIFTVVGGRVNVRLRLRLMDSLLTLEQGFYDVTKTGDITSRLSSDTTLVGDQVTLNVNVSRNRIVGQQGAVLLYCGRHISVKLTHTVSAPPCLLGLSAVVRAGYRSTYIHVHGIVATFHFSFH
jgi:hypothetical protein